ncbi:hypothetical protein FRB95_007947 [Tulasnella sp. JGI-2019a]|nr:hypothetical protein FRB93_008553 [Tulasnella sp. JGI-2019a]KAG9027264.1 hypothetical protein FRB95_007947 [Tulasnella sp. JGI-2019a]
MPRGLRGSSLCYHVLKLSLGSRAATQELSWIKQALRVHNPPVKDYDSVLLSLVQRRARGEPLAYVLGNQPFGPLSIKCRSPTLIPRPETEHWVMKLTDSLRASGKQSPISVLDICTGTGCIPLLLAKSSPKGSLHAIGVDVSPAAISLAKENVDDALRDDNFVKIVQGDLFSETFRDDMSSHVPPSSTAFDLITCNPPYIPRKEYDRLPPSVRDHEDQLALLGDRTGQIPDGLSFYRRLVEIIGQNLLSTGERHILKNGGIVVVEHGDGQSQAVQDIFRKGLSGRLSRLEAWKDQWDKHRAVMAVL